MTAQRAIIIAATRNPSATRSPANAANTKMPRANIASFIVPLFVGLSHQCASSQLAADTAANYTAVFRRLEVPVSFVVLTQVNPGSRCSRSYLVLDDVLADSDLFPIGLSRHRDNITRVNNHRDSL